MSMSKSWLDPDQPPHDQASIESPEMTAPSADQAESDSGQEPDSAPEPTTAGRLASQPTREGWALVALVPYDGHEPPADVDDELAGAVWCAVSALWHPAILARTSALPRVEPIESPTPAAARELRVVPRGTWDLLPSGYRTAADDAGAVIVEAGSDRGELVRVIEERLGAGDVLDQPVDEGMTGAARDYLALGTVRWMLRELTTAMGHADLLDVESLTRELLAGGMPGGLVTGPGR